MKGKGFPSKSGFFWAALPGMKNYDMIYIDAHGKAFHCSPPQGVITELSSSDSVAWNQVEWVDCERPERKG